MRTKTLTGVSAAVVAQGSWHKVNGTPRADWEINELASRHGGLDKIPGYEGEHRRRIYFIQSGSAGPIKIGYSVRPIERRLAALQTANPEILCLLACMDGDRSTEAGLHQQFRAHRRPQGEWFEPHPDLMQFIANLPKDTST
jgi:hypothetical protein